MPAWTSLPAVHCQGCLVGEYEAVIIATEDRINDIDAMVPGIDVAFGHNHSELN